MDVREELTRLSPLEHEVLAALALVGDAAISRDELAALAGVEDVASALDELVRRGLVRVARDDRATLRAKWRRVLGASDRARTILERAVVLAETGRLSPETLLGLTAWALRLGHYREALAIVRGAQEVLAVVRSVDEWAELLERARTAARALGDGEAEEWAERRLAAVRRPAGTLARRLVTGAAVAAAGVAGLLVGVVALDDQPARADPAGPTVVVTQRETVVDVVTDRVTVAVPTTRTVTEPGPVRTVTVTERGPVETVTVTETEPRSAETVTTTVTVTEPRPAETVRTTVTVTAAPPPPPSPNG